MDSDQNRPQADGANPPPAASTPDPAQDFANEPDFSGFQPDVRESLLPRWLHLSLFWVLGLGAAAALVMAGMFITQQRKTDKTLELLAASSRADLATPAVLAAPAAALVAERKPTDLVLLPEAAKTDTPPATRPGPLAQQAAAAPAGPAPKARAAVAPVTRAAPAKPKAVAKKKKPKRKEATVLARRGESRTWPRRRGDSITEKLNAAVAACRARPHAPGECNLRACDILGSSDPACR